MGGFRGKIYPINPRATMLQGLRVYASVRELPERPDLAIVCAPRQVALNVVDDCAHVGIPLCADMPAARADSHMGLGGKRFLPRSFTNADGHNFGDIVAS
jgi:hypothetical protein